ncbi:MAG: Uncharacterized protein G01um101429_748 [Parcubacteria group bacterium Gr01-1014_29]|nr:MAG: Uncharacterized protein G01um101429_748 [Parcubacteria group bacterium Gr01-1014_29]
MKKNCNVFTIVVVSVLFAACTPQPPTSDQVQQKRMETLVAEGVAQVGAPAIVNFQELRDMKETYELRDQTGLVIYVYLENMIPTIVPGHTSLGGKLTFVCVGTGYGLPYGTQFSNPEKVSWHERSGWLKLPQAEPNGLFMPSTAEGTWIKCKDPNGGKEVKPILLEPRGVYSPFKFPVDK